MNLGKPEEELVVLLETTDVGRIMVIKSLLESAEIPCLVQGAEDFRMLPLGADGGLFGPSARGAVIRVRRADLEDARKILEQQVEPPDDAM